MLVLVLLLRSVDACAEEGAATASAAVVLGVDEEGAVAVLDGSEFVATASVSTCVK